MARLGLFPVFVREKFCERTLPREPEPDLVMEGEDQVAAFAEAGRIDGVMAASYLFNAAHISQAIQGCATVVDLGCGPATQLALVAQLNPGISFIGVDLSPGMLASAAAHVRALGLTNVRFQQDDVSKLSSLADQSVDGVISTLALHHLPTHDLLRACFLQIRRILKPNGAIFIVDLGRLKSLKSVIYFAYMNAKHQPHIFSLDYERSLRAAFLHDDFAALAWNHVLRAGAADVEHRGQVGAYQTMPVGGLELLERIAYLDACIVDQYVERTRFCLDGVDCAFHRRLVGHVEGPDLDAFGIGEPFPCAGKLRPVAPVEDHAGARAHQALGQRQADALARAGDQGAFARQIEHRDAHASIPALRSPNDKGGVAALRLMFTNGTQLGSLAARKACLRRAE